MNAGASAVLVTLAGGATLLALAFAEPNARRRMLARRIALLQGEVEADPGPSAAAARQARAADVLSKVFSLGFDQTWGMKSSGPALAALALAAALAGLGAGRLLHAPALGMVALALACGYGAPRLLLSFEQRRAEAAFLENFPNAVDMIIRMLRAGLPITAAIRTVSEEAPGAVGQAFRRLGDQIQIGVGLGEALALAARDIRLADFRFFCVSVALQQTTGGNLASTLETLAEIIRKRRAVRLKAKALTAEVRMSSYILGAMPLVILVGLTLLDPGYLTPLLEDPRGRLLLGGAGLGLATGFLVMRQMMRRATAV